ncbi:MAG: PQQ-dependent sugar dehydrogenase, partial [Acidobacteria bacterium]|nr:PQQ-dependent sugar dehydrogenase [Acidobacteriota bacterium]
MSIGPATVGRLSAQDIAGQLRFSKFAGFGSLFLTSITNAADGSGRLFVTSQEGRAWIVKDGKTLPTPFLDIRSRTSYDDERGLLSIAFDPAYEDNGYFYAYYTDPDGNSVVSRFEVSEDPDIAAAFSETFVISIEQPFPRHNGGQLQFGPDGYLYIGTGDGGGTGDPGNRAQNLSLLLGKILRIDVHGGSPYRIPSNNPFRFQPGARDEIWAYGLRNPWRFSFDRETGDLLIGDVGQSAVEEINFQPAHSSGGENYGWRLMEGGKCHNPPADCQDGAFVPPVLSYEHDAGGRSVTGGYVYRGDDFPQLGGLYFYADWVTRELFFARNNGGTWTNQGVVDTAYHITAFGEDERGELYVADWSGGAIYRIEADHPRPSLLSIVPEEVMAGGASFTMTLVGTNFTSYSEVLWNSKPLPTTIVGKSTLQAEIAATDIANAGMAAVAVRNPQPGGGTSASVTFTIEAPPVIVPEIFEDGVGGASGITTLPACGRIPCFQAARSSGVASGAP